MAETSLQGRWRGPKPRSPPPAVASPTCPRGVLLTSPAPPSMTSPPPLPATGRAKTERPRTRSVMENAERNRSGEAWPDEFPLSGLFEELSLVRPASAALPGPLGAALSSVVQSGYLGKRRRNRRRYFVLRRASGARPSRLEWYKTEKRFREAERSAGEGGPRGPDRVVYLPHCLGVSKLAASRHGHVVALYTKDLSLSLVAEDQGARDEWYAAIKRLMEDEEKANGGGERTDGVNGGEALNEDDEGYWTHPPVSVFKEVWSVTVKPRGLGRTKSLAGESHLCLSATSLLLVRVGPGGKSPVVRTPLPSVRRCGHRDGLFFVELGRSAPHGPGEIWMEAGDRGDQVQAQSMHETVLEAMRVLRAPPDRSPISHPNWQSHPQPQSGSKTSRPKCREKAGYVKRVAPPFSTPSKLRGRFTSPSSPTLRHVAPRSPDGMDPESSFGSSSNFNFTPSLSLSPIGSTPSLRAIPSPRSLPFRPPDPSSNDWSSAASPPAPRDLWGSGGETGSRVEMMDWEDGDGVSVVTGGRQSVVVATKDSCTVAANGVAAWRQSEEEEEGAGPDYMTMSPQDASGLAAPWDDYMNMTSPHVHTWPPAAPPPSSSCSLQMLFSRPGTRDAPLNHLPNGTDQSDRQIIKLNQSDNRSTKAERPDTFTVRLLPMDQHATDQHATEQEVLPHLMSTSYPLETNSDYSQGTASDQSVPVHSVVRRHWLSSCLPSCLQAKGKD